jgi:hypothetical protein
VLGQNARGPTEARAHAGKSERGRLAHSVIGAYTWNVIQKIVLGPLRSGSRFVARDSCPAVFQLR